MLNRNIFQIALIGISFVGCSGSTLNGQGDKQVQQSDLKRPASQPKNVAGSFLTQCEPIANTTYDIGCNLIEKSSNKSYSGNYSAQLITQNKSFASKGMNANYQKIFSFSQSEYDELKRLQDAGEYAYMEINGIGSETENSPVEVRFVFGSQAASDSSTENSELIKTIWISNTSDKKLSVASSVYSQNTSFKVIRNACSDKYKNVKFKVAALDGSVSSMSLRSDAGEMFQGLSDERQATFQKNFLDLNEIISVSGAKGRYTITFEAEQFYCIVQNREPRSDFEKIILITQAAIANTSGVQDYDSFLKIFKPY